MRAYPAVVAAYVEELGFLAVQWRALLFATDVTVAQFREHEGRIEAILDGLRHAGEEALPVVDGVLAESSEPWEVFGAARAWLEVAPGAAAGLAARLEPPPAAATAGPAAGGGVGAAAGSSPAAAVAAVEDEEEAPGPPSPEVLGAWTEALRRWGKPVAAWPGDPGALAALLGAAGWADPLPLPRIEAAAAAGDPILRRAAARALGATRDPAAKAAARALLERLAGDAEPAIAAAALWGLCLAEPAGAAARLRARIAAGATPLAIRALGLFGDESDLERLDLLARTGEAPQRAAALRALGELGVARALDTVLAALAAEEEVAAAAADAYRVLTGKDVPEERADEVPPPPDDEEDEPEEPEDPESMPEDRKGEIPPDEPEEAGEEPEPAVKRDAAAARAAAPERKGRIRLGRPFGEADDMAWAWRRAVTTGRAEDAWLAREVPAGWFEGLSAPDARAGE